LIEEIKEECPEKNANNEQSKKETNETSQS